MGPTLSIPTPDTLDTRTPLIGVCPRCLAGLSTSLTAYPTLSVLVCLRLVATRDPGQ